MTNKQKLEIDFLEERYCFKSSTNEREEYIDATVHGLADSNDKFSNNKLRQYKSRYNLQITTWRDGLMDGTIAYWELLEDSELQHPYEKKVIRSLLKSVKGFRPKEKQYVSLTLALLNKIQ